MGLPPQFQALSGCESMLKKRTLGVGVAVGVAAVVVTGLVVGRAAGDEPAAPAQAKPASTTSITLTDAQLKSVKVVAAASREFAALRDAVGYIDFNQDRLVQVFSPWAGRVRQVLVKTGDNVRQGAPLYTIDSPDLVQAESALIASAGVLRLTTKALERAQKMHETEAASQRDLDQALSDQQSADGAFKAARDAVRIFGKSDAEIDRIVAERRVDGELRVVSPMGGQVTTRAAAPGTLVQPGNAPAPVTVADLSSMWMVANVTEYDLPLLHLNQEVAVGLSAYPGRRFKARITNIAASLDPATHRIAVRSELSDPKHELRPQMLATFVIRTGEPQHSVAVPLAGVVREGDGSMAVFVTRDGRRFERRAVQVGVEQEGFNQILGGLDPGEQVAADGALFLSNALALQTR